MKRIVPISVVLLGLVSCSQPFVETFGSISGTVSDSGDAEPLSGVTVSLTPPGLSQITGEDGTFQFDNLDVQEYLVSFMKDGYHPMSQKVSVKPGVTSSVQMMMSPVPPSLRVTPVQLEFGSSSSSLALDITNAGKGALTWSITENVDWLTCTPSSGIVTSGNSPVTVSVSRTGLEHGSYAETFVISSNGGSQTVSVRMNVEKMFLMVNPSQLDFGTILSSVNVSLTNTGTGAVRYNVSSSNDWLTTSKKSGTVTDKDNFNAVVSRAGLASGSYTGTLIISTDAGDISLPVNMEVPSEARPVVTMEGTESVYYNGAVLKGNLVSVGSSKVTRHGFCWSASSKEPAVSDECLNLGDASEAKSFTGTLQNLKSETDYYVRAFAENDSGISYSEKSFQFTTRPLPTVPMVATGDVSDIDWTTVTVSGALSSLGNVESVSSYGHVWGTSANPALGSASSSNTDLGSATDPISFSSHLTGLKAGKEYHVRAYAVNSQGVSYGKDVVFTTKTPEKPVVVTLSPERITSTSAHMPGELRSFGGVKVTDCGIYFGKSTSGMSKYSCGEGIKSFGLTVLELEDGTTYHYKAYAVNSVGESTGETLSFTTEKIYVPTVVTESASGETYTSVTLSGSIKSSGNSNVTEYGFFYGITPSPQSKVVVGKGTMASFSVTVDNLKQGTKYYFKAYAVNVKGVGYGDVMSFTTKIEPYNGHAYVNLGLPSGVRWASVNIGANRFTDRGNYYQWGQTVEYGSPDWQTPVGEDISGTQFDVARKEWGGLWRIPTKEEWEELVRECKWSGGGSSWTVQGPNGNVIYLGLTGGENGSSVFPTYNSGCYWTSTRYSDTEAYYLHFSDYSTGKLYHGTFFWGFAIRPVCSGPE